MPTNLTISRRPVNPEDDELARRVTQKWLTKKLSREFAGVTDRYRVVLVRRTAERKKR